jgi:hypothetical protein
MGIFGGSSKKTNPAYSGPICWKCRKPLGGGSRPWIGSGSDLVSQLSASPYNCKTCGTPFCVDCMVMLRKSAGNGICPKCGGDIGW